jgi:hypothetical protein
LPVRFNIKDTLELQASQESGDDILKTRINEGTETDVVSKSQTVTFRDETIGEVYDFPVFDDPVQTHDETPNVELNEWFSRPVKIGSYTWNESDTVGTTQNFAPWELYFNNPNISNKLKNYAFLSCTLKIKIMVNASPFYYGYTLMNYRPMTGLNSTTVITDSVSHREFVCLSQRPHIWIEPQNSSGGELTLPFVWHKNYLRTSTLLDFTHMGSLSFVVVNVLQSANGVLAAGVTVQIYAWAENVKLVGPTCGLVLQSSDEYGDGNGPISKPASALANFTRKFERLPVIGRFATATSIGATAVSRIASLFGFTNVPVIEDTKPLRPNSFPQFASPEIGYPVEKLTLDPKNELTVDPRSLGLPNEDELSVSYIAQREAWLTATTWDTTQAADTILFTSAVSPWLYSATIGTNYNTYLTPMCYLTNLFRHWRGDIIFRFKVICSQYHKGRLRITYDPAGTSGSNVTNVADTTATCFTEIVDIGKNTNVEIRVPYTQALAWLRCKTGEYSNSNQVFSTSTTPSFPQIDGVTNGTITVRVLTALTAPVLTSNILINVFVRAADNFELANPREMDQNYTMGVMTLQSSDEYLELQSYDDEDAKTIQKAVAGTIVKAPVDQRYLLNFGECVRSLRSLLRRTCLSYVDSVPTTTSGNTVLYRRRFNKIPYYYGYDASGIHSAQGTINPLANFGFNFVFTTPYNWLTPCFVGQRGSFIYHYNVDTNQTVNHVRVNRRPESTSLFANSPTLTKGTVSADALFFLQNTESGDAGCSLTNQKTQAGLSVLLPNYNHFRFQSTTPSVSLSNNSYDGSNQDNYTFEFDSTTSINSGTTYAKIWVYYSVGTDFSLYWFLNTPTLTKLAYPIAN